MFFFGKKKKAAGSSQEASRETSREPSPTAAVLAADPTNIPDDNDSLDVIYHLDDIHGRESRMYNGNEENGNNGGNNGGDDKMNNADGENRDEKTSSKPRKVFVDPYDANPYAALNPHGEEESQGSPQATAEGSSAGSAGSAQPTTGWLGSLQATAEAGLAAGASGLTSAAAAGASGLTTAEAGLKTAAASGLTSAEAGLKTAAASGLTSAEAGLKTASAVGASGLTTAEAGLKTAAAASASRLTTAEAGLKTAAASGLTSAEAGLKTAAAAGASGLTTAEAGLKTAAAAGASGLTSVEAEVESGVHAAAESEMGKKVARNIQNLEVGLESGLHAAKEAGKNIGSNVQIYAGATAAGVGAEVEAGLERGKKIGSSAVAAAKSAGGYIEKEAAAAAVGAAAAAKSAEGYIEKEAAAAAVGAAAAAKSAGGYIEEEVTSAVVGAEAYAGSAVASAKRGSDRLLDSSASIATVVLDRSGAPGHLDSSDNGTPSSSTSSQEQANRNVGDAGLQAQIQSLEQRAREHEKIQQRLQEEIQRQQDLNAQLLQQNQWLDEENTNLAMVNSSGKLIASARHAGFFGNEEGDDSSGADDVNGGSAGAKGRGGKEDGKERGKERESQEKGGDGGSGNVYLQMENDSLKEEMHKLKQQLLDEKTRNRNENAFYRRGEETAKSNFDDSSVSGSTSGTISKRKNKADGNLIDANNAAMLEHQQVQFDQLHARNKELQAENSQLKTEMQEMIHATDLKMQQVMQLVQKYEMVQEEKNIEKSEEIIQFQTRAEDQITKFERENVELKDKLREKEKEAVLLNTLLGHKQEDLLFSLEQLREMKSWAKTEIEKVSTAAKGKITSHETELTRCQQIADSQRNYLQEELEKTQQQLEDATRQLRMERSKCERLVKSTTNLSSKLETDLEQKLRVLNHEVEKVGKIGETLMARHGVVGGDGAGSGGGELREAEHQRIKARKSGYLEPNDAQSEQVPAIEIQERLAIQERIRSPAASTPSKSTQSKSPSTNSTSKKKRKSPSNKATINSPSYQQQAQEQQRKFFAALARRSPASPHLTASLDARKQLMGKQVGDPLRARLFEREKEVKEEVACGDDGRKSRDRDHDGDDMVVGIRNTNTIEEHVAELSPTVSDAPTGVVDTPAVTSKVADVGENRVDPPVESNSAMPKASGASTSATPAAPAPAVFPVGKPPETQQDLNRGAEAKEDSNSNPPAPPVGSGESTVAPGNTDTAIANVSADSGMQRDTDVDQSSVDGIQTDGNHNIDLQRGRKVQKAREKNRDILGEGWDGKKVSVTGKTAGSSKDEEAKKRRRERKMEKLKSGESNSQGGTRSENKLRDKTRSADVAGRDGKHRSDRIARGKRQKEEKPHRRRSSRKDSNPSTPRWGTERDDEAHEVNEIDKVTQNQTEQYTPRRGKTWVSL